MAELSNIKLTTDRVELSDPANTDRLVNAAIGDASDTDRRALGTIFFVIEIDTALEHSDEMINDFQKAITETYYHNREGSVELNFEKAIQEGNTALRRRLKGNNNTWLENFSGLIAAIHQNELHLSTIGSVNAFLVRGPRIVEIADQSGNFEKLNPIKIFSHLLSGDLQLGDRLFFCTRSILDYLSQEKIRQLIGGATTANAAYSIESLLRESVTNTNFAALVAGLSTAEDSVASPTNVNPLPQDAQASMEALRAQSSATTDLLAPKILPRIKDLAGSVVGTAQKFFREKILHKPPRRTVQKPAEMITPRSSYQPGKGERLANALNQTGKSLIDGATKALSVTINIFRRPRSIKDRFKRLPGSTNENINRSVSSFNRLSPSQQRLLVGALILLFVFSVTIVWSGISQEASLSNEEKTQLVTDIEQYIFQAEAALSYGDESGALTLFVEANAAMAQYPERSKEDKQQLADWQASIATGREQTKHITRLEQPTIYADLATNEITSVITETSFLGGDLFTSNNDSLVIISSTNTVEKKEIPAHQGEVIEIASIGQNIILLLTSGGQMIEYNTTQESFALFEVPFANQDRAIIDMANYKNRVYFLDPKNNQIFRHNRGSAGFGPSAAWIADPEYSVSQARSLAIDGSVYVLDRSGVLTELFQGQPQASILELIEPPLENTSVLWTNSDSNFHYLIDPTGNRLVVFTKSGTLKDQYVSEKFAGAQALAVNENEATVYLLNGTTIYEIPLNN